jgi:hypothetical protein
MPFTHSIQSDLLEGSFTNLHSPQEIERQQLWKQKEAQKWNKYFDELQIKVQRQRETIKENDLKRKLGSQA